ncbi:MAG: carboxymuconolactone decarboxylase family protein [Planctomycetes bacterium]|nr:carboxymuconolactone decarboxylase family protein [Planctomycetota bacterium]
MDNRVKELIALGAAVGANCQPCLLYHVGKAGESGANEQEIREAIAVAKIVREGAAGMMDQFISTTMKDDATPSGPEGDVSGCELT